MVATPAFRLIVGLGNPGRDYVDTRHNVGFMLVDRLAARERASWKKERAWQSEVARVGDAVLCKPLTYMNLSGQAVRPLASFYKIEPSQVLLVLDDMALPLGRLRLRSKGSSGGHNGLQSVIEHFGTPALPRLRIGIGAAEGGAVGHVLGRFALDEAAPLAQSLDRALAAVDCAQSRGFEAAMNVYNQPEPSTPLS
ncbi:MAG TPA: aminoacyl-tRNA hydrolase [Chthoniobacteraceae bacterium]|jgi:PTH1 family peptidyl-tRNA hydrolase|nr:aminoacyl-tRNA hydrolase [Chthoniobacteraceae bacterium]